MMQENVSVSEGSVSSLDGLKRSQHQLTSQLAEHQIQGVEINAALGELTLSVQAGHYVELCRFLHDVLSFHILIDLCGVDYATHAEIALHPKRFAIVLHLLSIDDNKRVRVKVALDDDVNPNIESVISVWNAADWYEREAFDMFGIVFKGHGDLRRLLTDYGFIGHPLRKDFPVSGHVEMRYDTEQKRVIYQPVTIDPREITPRIVRESGYGHKN